MPEETRYPGFLRGDDLAKWKATKEGTVSYDYAGVKLHKTGSWGQGPMCLQQLALLKGFDLAGMDPCGAEFIHVVLECCKLALADRDVFYGDPDFAEVPIQTLLSDTYNDERRKLVGRVASTELRPGNLLNALERLKNLTAQAGRDDPDPLDCGEPIYLDLPPEPGDTCYLSVVDSDGNMVSATPSGGWLQGSPTVPGLGFCVTTRGQMFWLDDGLPSSLRPGARPRTTLSPSLVTRDGEAILTFGAPGGDWQGQWPLFAFLRTRHHRMSFSRRLKPPNFHCEHYPESFLSEKADPRPDRCRGTNAEQHDCGAPRTRARVGSQARLVPRPGVHDRTQPRDHSCCSLSPSGSGVRHVPLIAHR